MARPPRILALTLGLLAAPVALSAQATDAWHSPAQFAAVGALRAAAEARSPWTQPTSVMSSPRSRRRQGTVLMIVGAAGIVTGLIVDEPIVTIAGAGVGGFGLYMFLNSGGEVKVGARRPVPRRSPEPLPPG